jgi:alpha-ketoglutarate-dependent 2,4-dichlorophenoxyacetate dioxygenase
MPELVDRLKTAISISELHPTFGAQISGVDFSLPISDEVFTEILKAITKVRC